MTEIDLSGGWSGVYNYAVRPGLMVPFQTTLIDTDGVLAGMVEEKAIVGPSRGRRIGATFDGRRTGRDVMLLKIYDRADYAYDTVQYHGEVNEDATEISGQWIIGSAWSGTFTMVRDRAKTAAATRRAEALLK